MDIQIATLCDFAADYGNGKLVINGTFDALCAPQLPVGVLGGGSQPISVGLSVASYTWGPTQWGSVLSNGKYITTI